MRPSNTSMTSVKQVASQPREVCNVVMYPNNRPAMSLLAIGGMNLHKSDVETPGKCVLEYQPWENKWVQLSKISVSTHHHTATLLEGKLCVMGTRCTIS